MTRPVFLITLGAVAGAVVGVVDGTGDMGREIAARVQEAASPYLSRTSSPPPVAIATPADDGRSHAVFSACLHQSGADSEAVLRDLLEYHDHDATLTLVDCLLGGEPQRFCTPSGREQAADAMEIYLWSREDAHRTSPAHGLADKIRWLDRVAKQGLPAENADPFVVTWSGPRDRAIFEKLRLLVKQGYLDSGGFAYSGRPELREALREVKSEASPCNAVADER